MIYSIFKILIILFTIIKIRFVITIWFTWTWTFSAMGVYRGETSWLQTTMELMWLHTLHLIIDFALIYVIVALIRKCEFRVSWTKNKKRAMVWMPLMISIVMFAMIALGFYIVLNSPYGSYLIQLFYGSYIIGLLGVIYLAIVLTNGNPKIKK